MTVPATDHASLLELYELDDNTAKVITNGLTGNFGWLATDKKHADANTLSFTLTNAGGFAYIKSDLPLDGALNIGDWVHGNSGISMRVRESLDWLINNQVEMTIPVWDATETRRKLQYQITNFARVKLGAYDPTGLTWMRFTNIGPATCNNQANTPPLVNAGPNQMVILPTGRF